MPSDAPPAAHLAAALPAQIPGPLEAIYLEYAMIARNSAWDAEQGLGGKLLYAGNISAGSGLLYAANVAGAESVAGCADATVLRQATRNGVVDFVVTSLEEALRILKNEVRKRQTVSVGVSVDPRWLTEQMLDRGVLPDLLPPASATQASGMDRLQVERLLAQGSRQIGKPYPFPGKFVTWSVEKESARWLPQYDACALGVMPAEDVARQRWLRLAPRYLGRMAQRIHGVAMDDPEEARFISAIREMGLAQSEAPPVEVQSNRTA